MRDFASRIAKDDWLATTKDVPWEVADPIPSGMAFRKARNQLLAAGDRKLSMRFRRARVYVGGFRAYRRARRSSPQRTQAMIQSVTKMWWKYGPMNAERGCAWRFVRLVRFTSATAFVDESAILAVGDPVVGLNDASNSEHDAALLPGRRPISDVEWKLGPPRNFLDDGSASGGDAIVALRAWAKGNFAHFRAPRVPFAMIYGFRGPNTWALTSRYLPWMRRARARPTLTGLVIRHRGTLRNGGPANGVMPKSRERRLNFRRMWLPRAPLRPAPGFLRTAPRPPRGNSFLLRR